MNEDFFYIVNTNFLVLLNLNATLDDFQFEEIRFTSNLELANILETCTGKRTLHA